jgi:hypothetical protein
MDEIRQTKRAHTVVADFDMLDTSTTKVVIMILQPFWLVNLTFYTKLETVVYKIRTWLLFQSLLFFYKVLYYPSMYNTPSN